MSKLKTAIENNKSGTVYWTLKDLSDINELLPDLQDHDFSVSYDHSGTKLFILKIDCQTWREK